MVGTSAAEATIRAGDTKLARYRAALEAGTDPADRIKQVTAERNAAAAVVAAGRRSSAAVISPAEVRDSVEAIGGLLPLLEVSDPVLRSRFYEEVGLTGTYDPRTRVVDVKAHVLNDRVGRAFAPLRTRIEVR